MSRKPSGGPQSGSNAPSSPPLPAGATQFLTLSYTQPRESGSRIFAPVLSRMLDRPKDGSGCPHPSGYFYFPKYGEKYFKQIRAGPPHPQAAASVSQNAKIGTPGRKRAIKRTVSPDLVSLHAGRKAGYDPLGDGGCCSVGRETVRWWRPSEVGRHHPAGGPGGDPRRPLKPVVHRGPVRFCWSRRTPCWRWRGWGRGFGRRCGGCCGRVLEKCPGSVVWVSPI